MLENQDPAIMISAVPACLRLQGELIMISLPLSFCYGTEYDAIVNNVSFLLHYNVQKRRGRHLGFQPLAKTSRDLTLRRER